MRRTYSPVVRKASGPAVQVTVAATSRRTVHRPRIHLEKRICDPQRSRRLIQSQTDRGFLLKSLGSEVKGQSALLMQRGSSMDLHGSALACSFGWGGGFNLASVDAAERTQTCGVDWRLLCLSSISGGHVAVFHHAIDHPIAPRLRCFGKARGAVMVRRLGQSRHERRFAEGERVYGLIEVPRRRLGDPGAPQPK